jgi:hypothetical protein
MVRPDGPRFVVITKNSARWFGVILDAYKDLGIHPFVLLDRSSGDGTEQLLIDRSIEHVTVTPEEPRVESMIRHIPQHVRSEWVFRLDDDELPSRGVLQWMAAHLARVGKDVVGFQRRWIKLSGGRCEYSRHPLIATPLGVFDTQWRLFRPARVTYRSEIHTPGFHVPWKSPIALGGGYIAHFTWLTRTKEERRGQVDDYDRQETNAGSRFQDIKVWEDSAGEDHGFRVLESHEFDDIAKSLAATSGSL